MPPIFEARLLRPSAQPVPFLAMADRLRRDYGLPTRMVEAGAGTAPVIDVDGVWLEIEQRPAPDPEREEMLGLSGALTRWPGVAQVIAANRGVAIARGAEPPADWRAAITQAERVSFALAAIARHADEAAGPTALYTPSASIVTRGADLCAMADERRRHPLSHALLFAWARVSWRREGAIRGPRATGLSTHGLQSLIGYEIEIAPMDEDDDWLLERAVDLAALAMNEGVAMFMEGPTPLTLGGERFFAAPRERGHWVAGPVLRLSLEETPAEASPPPRPRRIPLLARLN